MFKFFLSILLLPFSVFSQVTFLNPSDFEAKLRVSPNAVLLDLRDIESYEKGHIKKAIVVDFLRDDFKDFFLARYSKNTNIFLYAQSESSTLNVANYIKEIGFTQITALNGGFENWISKSKPYKSLISGFSPLSIVSKENYLKTIQEKKRTIVLFYENNTAELVNFEQSVNSIPDFFLFKIEVKNNQELAEWRKIYNTPTVLLYKNGAQIWKFEGIPSKEALLNQIY